MRVSRPVRAWRPYSEVQTKGRLAAPSGAPASAPHPAGAGSPIARAAQDGSNLPITNSASVASHALHLPARHVHNSCTYVNITSSPAVTDTTTRITAYAPQRREAAYHQRASQPQNSIPEARVNHDNNTACANNC